MKKILTICCFILAVNQIHPSNTVDPASQVTIAQNNNTVTLTLTPAAQESTLTEVLSFMDLASKATPLFITTMKTFIITKSKDNEIDFANAKFTSSSELITDDKGKIKATGKGGSHAKANASFTYNQKGVDLIAHGDVSYRKGALILTLKFKDKKSTFSEELQSQISAFVKDFKKAAGITS